MLEPSASDTRPASPAPETLDPVSRTDFDAAIEALRAENRAAEERRAADMERLMALFQANVPRLQVEAPVDNAAGQQLPPTGQPTEDGRAASPADTVLPLRPSEVRELPTPDDDPSPSSSSSDSSDFSSSSDDSDSSDSDNNDNRVKKKKKTAARRNHRKSKRDPITGEKLRDLKVDTPEKYSGGKESFDTFINSCKLYFSMRRKEYAPPADQAKISLAGSCLTGSVKEWFTSNVVEHKGNGPRFSSFEDFVKEFRLFIGAIDKAETDRARLLRLQQSGRVADFNSRFISLQLSAGLASDNPLVVDTYRNGLKTEIREALLLKGKLNGKTLQKLMKAALKYDNELYAMRMQDRSRGKANTEASVANPVKRSTSDNRSVSPSFAKAPRTDTKPFSISAASTRPDPKPLTDNGKPFELVDGKLPQEIKELRRKEGRCTRCGKHGHFVAECGAGKPGMVRVTGGNATVLVRDPDAGYNRSVSTEPDEGNGEAPLS